MDGLIGKTLGPYRILEQIGRGGMATVYKAYQPSLDRYVAVKVLPPHLSNEAGFSRRFRREARAVAKLEHPRILAVYDFGQEDDLSYIAMRYVDAGTLKDLMDQPLDLVRIADLIGQIAEALDYAHEHGIVHRDVKPSNVLLDRGEWVLLMDFGLARMMEGSQQITATGVGIGTPDYMSPEQGQAKRADRRSDVYSLGVVLYEMLTGEVPYQAETPIAVVLKHISEPLPLPRDVNPEIPAAMERVVLKAMAKAPKDRYQTAGELARALQAAAQEAATAKERSQLADGVLTQDVLAKAPRPAWTLERLRKFQWVIPAALLVVGAVVLLSRVPLRVQISDGQLEVVRVVEETPALSGAEEATSEVTQATTPTASSSEAEASPPIEPQGQRFYLQADGILATEPPPSNSSSNTECFFECTETWAITLTQPLKGNAYGYDLVGIHETYNLRILHSRGSQQTVLAEWLLRKSQDSGLANGPQLDAIPGDVLTLEITLPESGNIQSFDYGSYSYISVSFVTGALPEEPTPPPPESPETAPHPALAVGPEHQIHLAWADKSSGAWEVYYTRSADEGATFSQPIALDAGAPGTARGHTVLVIGAGGDVHVAWEDNRSGNWDIYYTHSADGETFSPPIRVNDDAAVTDQVRPAIAVGADGSIYLTWQDSRGGDWDVYYARLARGSASFSANERVNNETRGEQEDPAIGVDSRGLVHLAWADKRSGAWAIYYVRLDGDRVSQSHVMEDGLANTRPAMAVASDDSVHIAWANAYIKHPTYGALLYLPAYATSADGGETFSDPRQVGEGYGYVSISPPETGLAADDGVVHVVLTTYSPRDGNFVWYYRSNDNGQSFGEGVAVQQEESDVLHEPVAAVGEDGRIHVAWAHQRDADWDVNYTLSSDGGATFPPGWKVIGGESGIVPGPTAPMATSTQWDVLVLAGHTFGVNSVAWSPDGTQLASGGEGKVQVWDPGTGRELRVLEGLTRAVQSVAWSPDGTQLALGSADGTMRIWNIPDN